jgi:hypothetical protein
MCGYETYLKILMGLTLFLGACESCGRIPLHEQCGIYTADKPRPAEQMVAISEVEMEKVVDEIPATDKPLNETPALGMIEQ